MRGQGRSRKIIQTNIRLRKLLAFGMRLELPANRPLVTDVQIPALHSSLLGFGLKLRKQVCGDDAEPFTPLLRQYLNEPHESRYFVNVKEANITLHSIAPFMPPPLRSQAVHDGVSLQTWSDPTCSSSINTSVKVGIAGSMVKPVMRYRMVFAAFPLLVIALVLRKQSQLYDQTGECGSKIWLPWLLMIHRPLCDFFGSNRSLSSIFITFTHSRLNFLGTVPCSIQLYTTQALHWLAPSEKQCYRVGS